MIDIRDWCNEAIGQRRFWRGTCSIPFRNFRFFFHFFSRRFSTRKRCFWRAICEPARKLQSRKCRFYKYDIYYWKLNWNQTQQIESNRIESNRSIRRTRWSICSSRQICMLAFQSIQTSFRFRKKESFFCFDNN